MRRAELDIRSKGGVIRLLRRKWIVLGGVLLAGIVGVGIAVAASNIVTDTDNVHLRVVESHFDDGFVADWHVHPGPVIVQVKKGRFTIWQNDCKGDKLGTGTKVKQGDTYIEIPNVPVKAEAKGEIEWTTSLIYETGRAASTPAAPPCD